MGTWNNDDGLYVRFGTTKTVEANGGESTTDGKKRTVTVRFKYSDLAAAGTEKILLEGVTIPSGAFLESATLTVLEAFDSSGNTATLSLGLIDSDRLTAWDADGIDATIAETAIDAVGDVITCDGALIGTVLSNSVPGYITATVGTEAFTAGKAELDVVWYQPEA